jgi:hypothetical protein
MYEATFLSGPALVRLCKRFLFVLVAIFSILGAKSGQSSPKVVPIQIMVKKRAKKQKINKPH